MAQPLVTVCIPVGPRHADHVGVAVASALNSTIHNLEVVVANDTGRAMAWADPRVTVVEAPEGGPGLRPAIARNTALLVARGVFSLQLDADDYLLPDGLAILVRAFAAGSRSYVYGHHYGTMPNGEPVRGADGKAVINNYGAPYDSWDYTASNLHAVSALVPTALWHEVGGFDTAMPGWDDWGGFARLRRAGHCGEEVRMPVFVYRVHLSQQHHADNAGGLELMARARARIIGERWAPMGCGCGGGATAARQAAQAAVLGGGVPQWTGDDTMRVLRYTGAGQGSQTFRVNGRSYRAGNNATNRYLSTSHTLHEEDVADLLALGVFEEVAPPPAFAVAPEPVAPVADAGLVVASGEDEEVTLDLEADDIAVPSVPRRERARRGE